MRVVFFGTPRFAAQILEYLVQNEITPVAIVTKEDKPIGRSGKPKPPAVKAVAQTLCPQVPIYQPQKVSTSEMESILQSHNPDLFVVVAYGEIVKQNILDIPSKGCINVHASLLPLLRGASPIQQSIIEGHGKTGVTIMEMVMKMDAGDILATAEIEITPSMTSGELTEKLCELSCPLLLDVLRDIQAGEIKPAAQNHAHATYVKKITTEDCKIDWSKPAKDVHNLVRGLQPKPCAWTDVLIKGDSRRMKIHKTHVVDKLGKIGEVSSDEQGNLVVHCGKGSVVVEELQLEGKKKMSSSEFIRGTVITSFL